MLLNQQLRADDRDRMEVGIFFGGPKYFVNAERQQILDLLFSTYEQAVQRNQELSRVQDELTHVNENLESTVRERTSELAEEIEERKRVELKLQGKLVRLQLLRRITRAIGDRLDLRHVFQVVCDSIEEQLPVDFCAIALYDTAERRVTVCSVGAGSRARADRLGLVEASPLTIDDGDLARCMRGALVHEPDLTVLPFAFARRLADGGLHSAVLAPLQTEESVFGILIAAREQPKASRAPTASFSASSANTSRWPRNQAQLHGALQRRVRRPSPDAAGGAAAGTLARARRNGQRHRARHQQRDFAGGAVHRVAAREGDGAERTRTRAAADGAARDRRRGRDGGAHARVLSAAR